MTASLGAKEIKILGLSLIGGFLLLFPRMLLMHEVAPSLVQTVQKFIEQSLPQASSEPEKAGMPPPIYRDKPKKRARSGSLHVEGIIYEGKGQSSVIIDGQILMVGDSIGDYRVIEIQSQHVVLKKGEDLYILSADSTLEKGKA